MQSSYIIKKPLITEKSMVFAKQGKFTFVVAVEANKNEIRKAVEDQFKVDVVSIETILQKGGSKRVGVRRVEKTVTPMKKAMVTLKEGQKIDMFDLGV